MFSKGLQAFSKLKDKIELSIFTSQSDYPNKVIRLTHNQCPPLVIDDIVFHLNTLPQLKQSKKTREKIIKFYDDKYLQKLQKTGITVQIIGQKYFFYVHRSTQTKYNHGHSLKYLNDHPKYLKLLRQIHQNKTLMKHFWSIDFCNLKVLNLSGHQLASLEGITFMSIPHLQCLELHNNHLQSIDCLSKMSVPKLRILTLYSNNIQRCDKITRVGQIRLQEWEFDTDNLFEDYRVDIIDFMFKLKSFGKLKKIYIQDEKRICNKKKINFMQLMVKNWKLPESYRAKFANIHINYDFEQMILD